MEILANHFSDSYLRGIDSCRRGVSFASCPSPIPPAWNTDAIAGALATIVSLMMDMRKGGREEKQKNSWFLMKSGLYTTSELYDLRIYFM